MGIDSKTIGNAIANSMSRTNTAQSVDKPKPKPEREKFPPIDDGFEASNSKLDISKMSTTGAGKDGPIPTTAELKAGIEKHQNLAGKVKLNAEELDSLKDMGPDERRMYGAVIGELDALKAGKINAGQYQANVMDHAARIAGKDGEKFVDLTAMAFSDSRQGWQMDIARTVAGNPRHPAGSVLEQAFNGTKGQNEGFNKNVLDTESKYDSVSHHFGAFFDVGGSRGKGPSSVLAGIWDSKDTNPGDVRQGRFGAMLGDGAASGEISPADASKLHRWAFTEGGGPPPPWGNDATKAKDGTHFTSHSDFSLNEWAQAYNKAHPDSPISLKSNDMRFNIPLMP